MANSKRVLELDQFVRDNAAACKLSNWAELVEQVQVPPAIAAAFVTGRPELIKLLQPTALTAEEAKSVFNLVAVLIETNNALQQHAQQVAQSVSNWGDAFKHLQSVGEQVVRFANFETVGKYDDEEQAA